MIRTKGLTHIHLAVRNMKRSVRFYRTAFGMKVTFKIGPKMVFLNTPGSRDVITLHEDGDLADMAGTSGGISHFGFELMKMTLTPQSAKLKRPVESCWSVENTRPVCLVGRTVGSARLFCRSRRLR